MGRSSELYLEQEAREEAVRSASAELYDACEMALETLIGCCIPAGGCDDRKTILLAQKMLRMALESADGRRRP